MTVAIPMWIFWAAAGVLGLAILVLAGIGVYLIWALNEMFKPR